MSISEIATLFTGVALFLFGMSLMGDGLKRVSGSKLEPILSISRELLSEVSFSARESRP